MSSTGEGAERHQQLGPALAVERAEDFIQYEETRWSHGGRADELRHRQSRAERDDVPLAARKPIQFERLVAVEDLDAVVLVEMDVVVFALGHLIEEALGRFGQERTDVIGDVLIE